MGREMTRIDELRREFAALEEKLARLRQGLADAAEERRGLSRALIDNDKAAVKRDGVLATEITQAHRTIEAALVVRAELQHELGLEEAKEAEKLREARRAEALAFADTLAARGAEFDRFLREFRAGIVRLKDELGVARGKGLLPANQRIIEIAIAQAFRTHLWCTELSELALEPPDTRRSFEYYCRAWSDSVRGSAGRRLAESAEAAKSPAAPKPPAQWPSALMGDADDQNFRIYENKRDADQALEQASKGPNT
jgi:hypothetical protein